MAARPLFSPRPPVSTVSKNERIKNRGSRTAEMCSCISPYSTTVSGGNDNVCARLWKGVFPRRNTHKRLKLRIESALGDFADCSAFIPGVTHDQDMNEPRRCRWLQ